MTTSLVASVARSRPLFATYHETPIGTIYAHWSELGLLRIDWPAKVSESEIESDSRSQEYFWVHRDTLDEALEGYFAGCFAALDSIQIDAGGWTGFFAEVYRICRKIPAGATRSYAEIAVEAGSPRAARAVGQAMRSNRLPLVIPCHRVLASGGGLGGYSGPGGIVTKRRLLELEGAL